MTTYFGGAITPTAGDWSIATSGGASTLYAFLAIGSRGEWSPLSAFKAIAYNPGSPNFTITLNNSIRPSGIYLWEVAIAFSATNSPSAAVFVGAWRGLNSDQVTQRSLPATVAFNNAQLIKFAPVDLAVANPAALAAVTPNLHGMVRTVTSEGGDPYRWDAEVSAWVAWESIYANNFAPRQPADQVNPTTDWYLPPPPYPSNSLIEGDPSTPIKYWLANDGAANWQIGADIDISAAVGNDLASGYKLSKLIKAKVLGLVDLATGVINTSSVSTPNINTVYTWQDSAPSLFKIQAAVPPNSALAVEIWLQYFRSQLAIPGGSPLRAIPKNVIVSSYQILGFEQIEDWRTGLRIVPRRGGLTDEGGGARVGSWSFPPTAPGLLTIPLSLPTDSSRQIVINAQAMVASLSAIGAPFDGGDVNDPYRNEGWLANVETLPGVVAVSLPSGSVTSLSGGVSVTVTHPTAVNSNYPIIGGITAELNPPQFYVYLTISGIIYRTAHAVVAGTQVINVSALGTVVGSIPASAFDDDIFVSPTPSLLSSGSGTLPTGVGIVAKTQYNYPSPNTEVTAIAMGESGMLRTQGQVFEQPDGFIGVKSASELRALISIDYTGKEWGYLKVGGTNSQVSFDINSTVTDDGVSVLKPTDRASNVAGRYIVGGGGGSGGGFSVNFENLSANRQITSVDAPFQNFDPQNSNYQVILPSTIAEGNYWEITNSGTTGGALLIKETGAGATLFTLVNKGGTNSGFLYKVISIYNLSTSAWVHTPVYNIAPTGITDAPIDTKYYVRKDEAWVESTKASVGLSNAENTSDLNKPLSTATIAALAGKLANVAEDTTPDLGGALTAKYSIKLTNPSDVNKGILGISSDAVQLRYSPDGGIDTNQAGIGLESGITRVGGTGQLQIEQLIGAGLQTLQSYEGLVVGVPSGTGGWSASDTDNGDYTTLGVGTGAGSWVNLTNLSVVAPVTIANNVRADASIRLWVESKSATYGCVIEIGWGKDGAASPLNSKQIAIAAGFKGFVAVVVDFAAHGGLTGTTTVINIYARRFSGANAASGADILGSVNNHQMRFAPPDTSLSVSGLSSTVTTANFVVPAINASVTVAVSNSAGINGITPFNGSYLTVTGAPSGTSLTVFNYGLDNAPPPGVTINSGAIVGPSGQPGTDGAGWDLSSNSSATVGLGPFTFAVQAGRAWRVGMAIRALSSISPENWLQGTVLSYSVTTLLISVTSRVGSGTFTSWVFAVPPGIDGVAGEGFVLASNSSNTLGLGSKVFATTGNGSGWQVGTVVRWQSISTPTKFLQGAITAFTPTDPGSMTITADSFGGSGTVTDWAIQPATGATGSPGPAIAWSTQVISITTASLASGARENTTINLLDKFKYEIVKITTSVAAEFVIYYSTAARNALTLSQFPIDGFNDLYTSGVVAAFRSVNATTIISERCDFSGNGLEDNSPLIPISVINLNPTSQAVTINITIRIP